MKTNYFSKIENKYVFNMSLIFWHIFIALSTIAVIISLLIFLWSITPSFQKNVEKQSYPEKKQYPDPVKVNLFELKLEEVKLEEAPPESPDTVAVIEKKQVVEDITGKKEYESSFNTLKTLIPPSKYSWEGEGYWYYPQGERFWTYYKQEQYRQWISTEPGIDSKLSSSYRNVNAKNYVKKKQILDGFISIVKLLKEEKRATALQILMNHMTDNIVQNDSIYKVLTKVVNKMLKVDNLEYLDQLVRFGKINQNDGVPFIEYTATIINNFDVSQKTISIDNLVKSYYNYFKQDLHKQIESTNLFLPFLYKIKVGQQGNALMKYYGVYLNKNIERDNKITQIENEQQKQITEIETQYNLEQLQAQQEFNAKKESKQNLRYKSMIAIGISILIIVLIATILVFFSIQRSVRKIEEKIAMNPNAQV
ncbi:MAG: hypothetical protein Q8S41_09870 [Lutibacter sp.]|nr:hypothetical protein [Lutibacter sp.]